MDIKDIVSCPVCHLLFSIKSGKYVTPKKKVLDTTNTIICKTCKEFDEKEAWL
jgi:hypothetical protein